MVGLGLVAEFSSIVMYPTSTLITNSYLNYLDLKQRTPHTVHEALTFNLQHLALPRRLILTILTLPKPCTMWVPSVFYRTVSTGLGLLF